MAVSFCSLITFSSFQCHTSTVAGSSSDFFPAGFFSHSAMPTYTTAPSSDHWGGRDATMRFGASTRAERVSPRFFHASTA